MDLRAQKEHHVQTNWSFVDPFLCPCSLWGGEGSHWPLLWESLSLQHWVSNRLYPYWPDHFHIFILQLHRERTGANARGHWPGCQCQLCSLWRSAHHRGGGRVHIHMPGEKRLSKAHVIKEVIFSTEPMSAMVTWFRPAPKHMSLTMTPLSGRNRPNA